MSNFINNCINGDALMEDIDSYVEEWHTGDSTEELHDFLGMTKKEYELFLDDVSYLGLIISARRDNKDIESIIRNELAIAARSDDAAKAKVLNRWLHSEGLWD